MKAVLDQRAAEATYGVPTDQLTPHLPWTLPTLRKLWNHAKHKDAPWWAECSKEAYASGLDNLTRALSNWNESRMGRRKGPRVGFPRFRSKRNTKLSCRFTTGAIRVEPDRRHVTLPRLGKIKTYESTRKLARRVEAGTARILSATVKRRSGRWFCAFTCEVQRAQRMPTHPEVTLGVDVGITRLAVLSQPVSGLTETDGVVPNPKHTAGAQRRLRRACRRVSRRQGPNRRTGQAASRRWDKANQYRNKIHYRVANLRRDGLHKLTSSLARYAGTIVVEDLNVTGMLRNRRLARSVADAGFAEIRRMLSYKTNWNGGRLVVADRWYPSSKTCSDCGAVKTKLPLHIRVFHCGECGLSLDRDLNAARNLASLTGVISTTGAGAAGNLEPAGSNGRGADRKTSPSGAGGCETSIAHQPIG